MADEPTSTGARAIRTIRSAPGVLVRGGLRGELARHRAAHLHAARLFAGRARPSDCRVDAAVSTRSATRRAACRRSRGPWISNSGPAATSGCSCAWSAAAPRRSSSACRPSGTTSTSAGSAGAVACGSRRSRARARRGSKSPSARLLDGTLLQVGKSTESREELLARFRTIVALVSVAIVLVGLAGGILVTRRMLAADPPADRRGQRDHPDREHQNARAGGHRPRRHRRAERALQRDARSDQHAHRGHGRAPSTTSRTICARR